MSVFLDPRGRSTFGIGICARCQRKMSLEELMPDNNYPGLRVCKEDRDQLDPYRLAPRQTERITLDYPRPDVPINLNDFGTISQSGDLFIINDEGDGYLVP